METIKIGDAFKNWKNDIHVVNEISKTGLIIHAKNIDTGIIEKFRYYDASGKYIIEKTPNTDLGHIINIGCTLEINNLSKKELVKLKQEIDDRLKTIEVKEIKPKKGTILSLKQGDKIFGIRLSFGGIRLSFGGHRLSFGGHRLVEPKVLNGKVDVIDYCEITGIDLRDDSDDFRISILHPEIPFDIGTTLYKDDYKDEHCYLDIDTMKTGYDGFYTLKPENWKEDLLRMSNKNIENRKRYFQQNLEILEGKLNLFIQSENKINEHI
jgi:hypothetical protein